MKMLFVLGDTFVRPFEFLLNGSRSGVLASDITTPEFEIINLNATNVAGLFDGWKFTLYRLLSK